MTRRPVSRATCSPGWAERLRLVSGAGGALLGVAVAVGALPAHRQASWAGGVLLPWGLVLALAAAVACGLALRRAGWAMPGFAAGWSLLLLALMPGGPGGDYVYLNDVRGWGLLGGGIVVGTLLLGAGLGSGSGSGSGSGLGSGRSR